MDVYEMDENYILDAELPGVARRSVKVEFSGLEVTIWGDRKIESDCGNERYHMLEGHRGRFHRTFSLPEPVDRNRIRVDLKDGILHIVLPKSRSQAARGDR